MAHTIAAVATPLSPAGLGVIRVSGDDAIAVCERLFRAASGKTLSDLSGYHAAYGHVFDAEGDIDDCVALVFRAPHSYTGENTVELSCHGGTYILKRVLRAALEAGALPAQSGEFTRRAFLNGKMDLSGAEAVMDLIGAEGKITAKTALAAREGALYRRLDSVKHTLLSLSAQIAAFIDYPDDDVPPLPTDELVAELTRAAATLNTLLATADAGRILRDGIDTAIIGAPNVGKSTLMNLLSGCERSIVTDIAGTTRDIVEETVLLGDVRLRLSDTAGLHDTDDTVEQIGVERAKSRLETAALVLAVFDGSRDQTDEDAALLASLDGKTAVVIVNKTDLSPALPSLFDNCAFPLVALSAKHGDGLDKLTAVVETVTGIAALSGDEPMLANERQKIGAMRCLRGVTDAIDALSSGLAEDAAAVCIDDALTAVLELTGERVSDAVVHEVFSRFCVGK
ncbi:MAG: tRNA uridine-5-carboxymethylaminomethyl(34) synthesis GTPase MnmE [Clostridia bacterium]|nr:tRNA uridine-5-carboxymethylaminomethyl(34) synthesis GTPase MnmE [Clostridia bacterium]